MDMKNIYRIILIIILCTGVLPVCAQGNYYAAMPDVTPPSPTSRVFQKFLGYPISHATGTIDISIPLYTMEAYGFSPLDFEVSFFGGKSAGSCRCGGT